MKWTPKRKFVGQQILRACECCLQVSLVSPMHLYLQIICKIRISICIIFYSSYKLFMSLSALSLAQIYIERQSSAFQRISDFSQPDILIFFVT